MARRRLAQIPFPLNSGEVSKANPALLKNQGMTLSQNADGFDELGSLGQVSGSTRMSENAGAAWESLHYYEHYDLLGDFQREKLGLAGTTLYKINDDTTLQKLTTGLVAEPLTHAVMLDRVYLTSPNNDPMKYDGAFVTRWGVKAPGAEETILEAFDDHTDWVLTGAGSKANADGIASNDGSVQVNKDATTGTSVTITRSSLSLDFTATGATLAFVYLQIPEGAMRKFAKLTRCLEVHLTEGANTNEYYWDVGELTGGLNLLTLDLLNPDVDGSADLSAVDELVFTILLDSNGLTQDGFRWDHLYVNDAATPEATDDGAGAVTGNVTYVVTYVSEYGQESNASPASASFSAGSTGRQISLAIPVSPDPQVVSRRVYRDLNADGLWRLISTVNDNTTTNITDNVSSSGRGTTTPPLSSDPDKDYTPPRKYRQVVAWQDMLVGIREDIRFQIEFTYASRPEAWPTSRTRQFEFEVVALIPGTYGLEVHGTDRAVLIEGTNYSDLRFRPLYPEGTAGVVGWRAWAPFKRYSFIWHDDGPYANLAPEPWYLGAPIKDRIEAFDADTFRDMHVVHDRLRFRMIMFLQGSVGGDYDEIVVYSYGRLLGDVSPYGPGTDPLDIRTGVFHRLKLPDGMNPKCSEVMEPSGDQPQCWIGCDDGFVYWLGDPDAINWADGEGETAIDCEIHTSWFSAPENITFLARFLNLDTSATNASLWDVTVETAANPNEETADLISTWSKTLTFAAGSGSVEQPIDRGGHGEYARVTLRNNNLSEDGIVRQLLLEVIPRRVRRAPQ